MTPARLTWLRMLVRCTWHPVVLTFFALALIIGLNAGGCGGATGTDDSGGSLFDLWNVGDQSEAEDTTDENAGDGDNLPDAVDDFNDNTDDGDDGSGGGQGSDDGEEGPVYSPAQLQLIDGIQGLIAGTLHNEISVMQIDGAIAYIFAQAQSSQEAITSIDTALAASLSTAAETAALLEIDRNFGGWITDVSNISSAREVTRMAVKQGVPFNFAHRKLMGRAQGVLCPENAANAADTVVIYVNGVAVPRSVYVAGVELLRARVAAIMDAAVVKGMYQRSTRAAEQEHFGGVVCPNFHVAYPLLSELFMEACGRETAGHIDLTTAPTETLGAFYQPDNAASLGQPAELANMIENELLSGKRVILLTHSHGSYFVQAALETIRTRADASSYSATTEEVLGAIGTIAVGNPMPGDVASVTPHSHCISICSDNVALLRDPDGTGCVESSITAESASGWFEHNSLELAYLDIAGAAWDALEEALLALDDTLETPFENAGQGVLQVTLTWASEGDVDLYVDEPGGDRVYYVDRSGDVGTLDVDNVVAYGPENYFVCSYEELQSGNYDIGVNYYRGGPATVYYTIRVKAGFKISEFTGALSNPDAGRTIVPVTTVNVTRDGVFSIDGD